jgi:DNA repair ATPase RecN
MADWKRIKAEYIAGGTSYRKLAEKYDVPFGTLRRVAKQEGWTQKRTQVEHETSTKIVDAISDREAKNALDVIDVADKLLVRIADSADKIMVLNTQGLKNLTSALKDLKDIKGYKSAKDLEEQEARIAKLRREAEKYNDTTDGIEVVFNAGSEAWNE